MKNNILKALIFFLTFSGTLYAEDDFEFENPFIMPDSSFADPSLDSNEVLLSFHFQSEKVSTSKKILYNIDGGETKTFYREENQLTMKSQAGQHSFKFYLDSEHSEEFVMIEVEGGNHHYFTIVFTSSERMIMSEKPVIYLYPEETTDVTVKVNPTGDFTFTYPEYNDGWEVQAHADGGLYIGEDRYNYLFWESVEKWNANDENSSGFVIDGKNVTAFLEEKLTEAGLNSREKTDFITYWAPRIIGNDRVFINFIFNETCDRHATLDISPKPDNIYRIYMRWCAVPASFVTTSEQEIEKANREGFTVIEWGGQELPFNNQL